LRECSKTLALITEDLSRYRKLLDLIRRVRPNIMIARASLHHSKPPYLDERYGFEVWEEEMESMGFNRRPSHNEKHKTPLRMATEVNSNTSTE
jgi:hypothetical protein